MNISFLLRILWRQRKVVLPLAAFTILLCLVAVVAVPPQYEADASVVLLNPPNVPENLAGVVDIPGEYQNPYARYNDLSVIVDILVRVMESDSVGATLHADGLVGEFEVAANRDFYRGPIVDITATASSADQAMHNAQLVMSQLTTSLNDLQVAQGTDPNYTIQAQMLVLPDEASTVLTSTLRTLIIALAVGVFLTLGAGLFAEGAMRRRERAVAAMGDPAVWHDDVDHFDYYYDDDDDDDDMAYADNHDPAGDDDASDVDDVDG